MVSIAGLNRAAVLAALYNASQPVGMGFLQYTPKPMSIEDAEEILQTHTSFDYLCGRVMKVAIDGDKINVGTYNTYNGSGAAERVLDILRQTGNPNDPAIQKIHSDKTIASGEKVNSELDTPTTMDGIGINLGLADVKHVLGPAVQKAIGNRN